MDCIPPKNTHLPMNSRKPILDAAIGHIPDHFRRRKTGVTEHERLTQRKPKRPI
jgi:hypothetical protein